MNICTNISKKCIINSINDEEKFINSLLKRTCSFLIDEVHIKILKQMSNWHEVNTLNLRELTSIIVIEDCAKSTIVFTYDASLINEIFTRYTKGLNINLSFTDSLTEEISGDMINIIVGNVLGEFELPGTVFAISTPIIIKNGKYVSKYNVIKTYSTDIKTDYGDMSVYCILHGDSSFQSNRNLKE